MSEMVVTLNETVAVVAALEGKLLTALTAGAEALVAESVAHMGSYPPASSPGDYPAKRTGYLAGSAEIQPDGAEAVTVHWTAPYAAYLEYGTRKMAARPFVTPSLPVIEPAVIAALGVI